MQVTKGTWRMREQCVLGSLSSSPAQEPGNEAKCGCAVSVVCYQNVVADKASLLTMYIH